MSFIYDTVEAAQKEAQRLAEKVSKQGVAPHIHWMGVGTVPGEPNSPTTPEGRIIISPEQFHRGYYPIVRSSTPSQQTRKENGWLLAAEWSEGEWTYYNSQS